MWSVPVAGAVDVALSGGGDDQVLKACSKGGTGWARHAMGRVAMGAQNSVTFTAQPALNANWAAGAAAPAPLPLPLPP